MVISQAELNVYLNKCSSKNVHPSVMAAIVKTESNNNPFAININDKNNKHIRLAYQAKTLKQAQNWVTYLEKNKYNFDVGIAQINIKNIHKYGYTVTQALDICTNLKLASLILKQNYNQALNTTNHSQQDAIKLAISAYNTGNYHSGFSNGYVNKVILNYSTK